MSQLYTYPNGNTERRYTRDEARWMWAGRMVMLILTGPFVVVWRAFDLDYEDHSQNFYAPSIRLIDGGFYP